MQRSVVVSVIKSTHLHDVYSLKAGVQSLQETQPRMSCCFIQETTSESFHSDFEHSLCCEVHRCDTKLKRVALKMSNFYRVTLSSMLQNNVERDGVLLNFRPFLNHALRPLKAFITSDVIPQHWYRTSISSPWPLTSPWRKTISLSGDQHCIV